MAQSSASQRYPPAFDRFGTPDRVRGRGRTSLGRSAVGSENNSDSDGSVAGDHPLSMSPDPGRISILQGPTELLRRLQDGFGPADPGNHGFRITVSESDQGRRVDPKELAAEWLDEYS